MPFKTYKIYCEQMGDTDLSDSKFVEETRNLFALVPANRKSVLSCILHFLCKVSRITAGAPPLSSSSSASDKQPVNKGTLEKISGVFGPIVFRIPPANSNDPDATQEKQQALTYRASLLIDRIDRSFKAPSLDTSGEEAPYPSKPYPWFNTAVGAAEACAGMEAAGCCGSFFVMRSEETPSEYRAYYINGAKHLGSVAIVKTSNGCWKKENDDFGLFVSLRNLVEYFVAAGYWKTPYITNTDATVIVTSPESPTFAPTNTNANTNTTNNTNTVAVVSSEPKKVPSKKKSSLKNNSGGSSGSQSFKGKGGDDDNSNSSSSKHHHRRHHHSSHHKQQSPQSPQQQQQQQEIADNANDSDYSDSSPPPPLRKVVVAPAADSSANGEDEDDSDDDSAPPPPLPRR